MKGFFEGRDQFRFRGRMMVQRGGHRDQESGSIIAKGWARLDPEMGARAARGVSEMNRRGNDRCELRPPPGVEVVTVCRKMGDRTASRPRDI